MREIILKFLEYRDKNHSRMFREFGINTPSKKEPTFAEFIEWIKNNPDV